MTMTITTTEISCIYLPRVPLYVIVSLYRQRPHVYTHHESPVRNWMVRWRYLIVHWIMKRVLRSWALVVGIYMRPFPSRLVSGSLHFITRNKSIEHHIVSETGDYSSIWFVLKHSHMFTLRLTFLPYPDLFCRFPGIRFFFGFITVFVLFSPFLPRNSCSGYLLFRSEYF